MESRLRVRSRIESVRRLKFSIGRRFVAISRRFGRPIEKLRYPMVPVLVVKLDEHDDDAVSESCVPLFVSSRARFATASDVTWLTPKRVVAVYLLTHALAVFDFDDSDGIPAVNLRGVLIGGELYGGPEAVAASPDGRWLAITLSEKGQLVIGRIVDGPFASEFAVDATMSMSGDHQVHGVAVTRDGRFVGVTTIGTPGSVHIIRVSNDGDQFELEPISVLENTYGRLKPKGIDFTPDGRFVVLSYGCNAGSSASRIVPGFIEVRTFDLDSGRIGEVASRSDASVRTALPEVVAVTPDASRVVVSEQNNDAVLAIEFDSKTGILGKTVLRIGSAAGGLTFPHGCGVSPDQRWMAVTNYGDGSLRFFPVPV